MQTQEDLPRSFLREVDVLEIKTLLWDGTLTQAEIGRRFYASQPTISRILRGKEWDHIPWPDTSKGSMSPDRYRVILRSKHKAAHSARSASSRYITEKSVDAAKQAQEVVEKALEKRDKSFLAAIKDPGAATRMSGISRKKTTSWDALPWEEIKENDPANPLVREVEMSGDEVLKLAVCIALFPMPREEWATQQTSALAHRIADRLHQEKED